MALSPLLTSMRSAVYKTSNRLRRDFFEVAELQVSKKGPGQFVSSADLTAEKTLIAELRKIRPNASFYAEESGSTKVEFDGEGEDEQQLWIIDPLDGTTNFLHGLPHWCISIAYAEKGRVKAAMIFDAFKEELFTAELGEGAFLNEKRFRIAGRSEMNECIFGTEIPSKGRPDQDKFSVELSKIMAKSAGVRCFGSAALNIAYVAAGRLDGYWNRDLKAWNVAAGILMVMEAGGSVTDLSGKSKRLMAGEIVAANPSIHQTLLQELQS
ncbi:MAG: inositol monophosphatase family protein [Alphaproteobacteria bacterium]